MDDQTTVPSITCKRTRRSDPTTPVSSVIGNNEYEDKESDHTIDNHTEDDSTINQREAELANWERFLQQRVELLHQKKHVWYDPNRIESNE